ncbi:hypothetical protein BgiMline_003354, partial [Biomphalaria glabrata]
TVARGEEDAVTGSDKEVLNIEPPHPPPAACDNISLEFDRDKKKEKQNCHESIIADDIDSRSIILN